MKQNIKTILTIAATALLSLTLSCSKEMSDDPLVLNRNGIKRHINASATLPETNGDKAFLNNYEVLWATGDKLSVNGEELTSYNIDGTNANFEGTTHAMPSSDQTSDIYWAVYPSSLAGTYNGSIPADFQTNSLTVTLPATQNVNATKNPLGEYNYMTGYVSVPAASEKITFQMRNLCAVLKIHLKPQTGTILTNPRVSRLEFSSTNNKLAGKFTVSNDPVNPTVTPVTGQTTNKITVNLTDGNNNYIDITNGVVVYVLIPHISGNLTMRVFNTDRQYTERSVSSTTLNRNYVYTNTISINNFPKNNGAVSVSPTLKVIFSMGNLQWTSTGTHNTANEPNVTGTWRFAPHQWDIVGADNHNVSPTYTGWIDLFGWATSGYHNVNDASNANYQPYSTSVASVDVHLNMYGYGPSESQTDVNLVGTSANYDWGVYNDIVNPYTNSTDPAGTWRLLTNQECQYFMSTRSTTSGIRYAKAQVNGINGLIIPPDEWDATTYTLNHTNDLNALYTNNIISSTDWKILEDGGCVFLPTAGYRAGTTYHASDNENGHHYWTSTQLTSNGKDAWALSTNNVVNVTANRNRYDGNAVRLVRNYIEN